MAEKKTKTKKQTQPKEFKKVVEMLESIDMHLSEIATNVLTIVAQNETVLGNKVKFDLGAGTIHEVKGDVIAGESQEDKDLKQHLINQQGEAVELNYDTVKGEAQKLVKIDEYGEKKGFALARKIILGYGVSKLEDVAKDKYSEIVGQFRRALSEWK